MVKFKGDIQTLYLPHNETLYKEREGYLSLLHKLLEEDMIRKDDKGYKLTNKGVFWGNTLSRELSSLTEWRNKHSYGQSIYLTTYHSELNNK